MICNRGSDRRWVDAGEGQAGGLGRGRMRTECPRSEEGRRWQAVRLVGRGDGVFGYGGS